MKNPEGMQHRNTISAPVTQQALDLCRLGWELSNSKAFEEPIRRYTFVKRGRAAYEKAKELLPPDFSSSYLLAYSYLYNHEYGRASRAIERSLSLAPTYWPNWYMAGLINEARGRYSAAQLFFERFINEKGAMLQTSAIFVFHMLVFFHYTNHAENRRKFQLQYESLSSRRPGGLRGQLLNLAEELPNDRVAIVLSGGPGDQARAMDAFDRMLPREVRFRIVCDDRLKPIFRSVLQRPMEFLEAESEIEAADQVLYQHQAMNAEFNQWPVARRALIQTRSDFWDYFESRRDPRAPRRIGVSWRTFKPTERRMSAALECRRLDLIAPAVDELYILQADVSPGERAHLFKVFGKKLRFVNFDAYQDLEQLGRLLVSLDAIVTVGNTIRDLCALLRVPTFSVTTMPGLLDSWRAGQDDLDRFGDTTLHYTIGKWGGRRKIISAITSDLEYAFEG